MLTMVIVLNSRSGRFWSILRNDERNFNNPRDAGEHERVAKDGVDTSGDHECLGVVRHCPSCQDDTERYLDERTINGQKSTEPLHD